MPGARVPAAPFEVPAISNPATSLRLGGKLIWLDLETTDLPAAKRFYGALLGWDYRDYHAFGVDYTVALINGKPVAALIHRPVLNGTERRSAWLPFFSVADVGSTFTQALKANATVRSEPEDLPERGRQARLTDPEGAVFALLNSSSGDPSDDPNPRAIGTWGPPALLARDPAAEAVFYQQLFGLNVEGMPTDHGFERIRLVSDAYERANVRPLPAGNAALHSQWIWFARVFSTAETTRQAVKLGGRILVDTARASRDRTMTILEDPTGAAFGIVELPPEIVKLKTRVEGIR